jgi:hypothetical protein
MPKIVVKQNRTAKHKDSAKRQERNAKKEAKANQMDMDETASVSLLTEEEKATAKAERKKANAHKSLYKKNNYNITGRNGPRAVAE